MNGTSIFPAVKEYAFKVIACEVLPNGISAVDRDKKFPDKIDHIDLQETRDSEDFLVIYPDLSGCPPATVPGTMGTRLGIKAEVKTILI